MPLRRTLLVAASLFTALWCLMLIGGSRLIVSDGFKPDGDARAGWPPAVPAAACVWPGEPAGARGLPAADARAESTRAAEERGESRTQGAVQALGLARDANGNVLRAGPYMREAYRAFALEDAGG